MQGFIESTCDAVRAQVGKERVLLGLSGGVDSAVAAALLHQAIGDQLHCIFVDNGLLRKGEREKVQDVFGRHLKLKLHTVDAGAAVSQARSRASPIPSASGRSSAGFSSRNSSARRRKSARRSSSRRARFIPT